jgi:hypothetical protein
MAIMRQFKPGQLQTGSLYPISASFALTASYAQNAGVVFETGSLVTTASFNAATASLSSSISTVNTNFLIFSSSYATGSFTGSFSGVLTGTSSYSNNATTASIADTINVIGTGTSNSYNIVFSQTTGPSILRTDLTANLIYNPSTNLLVLGANASAGQLQVTGSINVSQGITGSLFGTASWAANAISSSYASGSSHAIFSNTASYVLPLNQDVAINGSLNVTTSLTASGLNYPAADNGEESFIQTNGNGTLTLQYVKTIYEEIVNGESTQLEKGTPVYVSGSQGAASVVYRADASNPTKMPVVYISADTLSAGQSGRGIALGLIKGVDTTGYPAGTEIYLAAGGGWTSTRPTGSAIVQILGYVTKEGNGGQGVILNPGPVLLPNLTSGSIWVGNNSSIPTSIATASLTVNSASYAERAASVTDLDQSVYISGSLTVIGNATFLGSASFLYVTASQLALSSSFISVNIFEPAERFGGLKVYDSGSMSHQATASLAWDSLHNHWVYQNASGSTYSGGMLLSGPRNTGSLGDEPNLTKWYVARSDGGDHLNNTEIYSSGSTTIVYGSLQATHGVTASFTGSYTGDGSGLYSIPASGIVGLNLSQIASGSASASISPNNGLQINTNVTATSFTGSVFGTASFATSASFAVTASYLTGYVSPFPFTGSAQITGSFGVTGSVSITDPITGSRAFISSSNGTANGPTLTVYGSGSAQPVFTIQGSQGELFSVTDSLSGSLFSVNDISGLPILEVFSDNTTLIGNYLDPMLITTAKVTQTNSGSFVMYSLPTASYDTAFFEYSVKSGSNARAGTIIAIQSGTSVNYTETTTTDFGTTSAVTFGVFVTGSNMALTGSSTSGAWTIKAIVRGI